MIQITPNPDYTEVTYEILAGMTSGVPAVMVSRISTGVTEGYVRRFSIMERCSLLLCLVEPLIQLALSQVLWFLFTETFLHYVDSNNSLYRKYMSLLQAFY